jgi:hypothetical protein
MHETLEYQFKSLGGFQNEEHQRQPCKAKALANGKHKTMAACLRVHGFQRSAFMGEASRKRTALGLRKWVSDGFYRRLEGDFSQS